MPAEDREQERRAPSVPAGSSANGLSAAGISMRDLLASCAAADAISKPPSDSGERVMPDDGGAAAPTASPRQQPEQNAA
jgi:hypothetical protein